MTEGRDNRGRFAKGNVPWNKKGQCPPHWWIINSNEVGHYKFYPAVKDFGALRRKESKRLSERHAEIVQDITGYGKRRGRPPAA